MFKFLRGRFIAGVLILAPLAVTGWILYKVFILFDNLIEPLQQRYPIIDVPGLGVIVVIIVVILTGFFAGNFIGRRIIDLGERFLNRIPLIRGIYTTAKEIGQVLLTGKRTVFRRVALVKFPHPGSYAVGFVTNEAQEDFNKLVDHDLVNIFLPTAPNPTSGYLLLVPRKDVVLLDMSVEDGLKLVISGGSVVPTLRSGTRPRQ